MNEFHGNISCSYKRGDKFWNGWWHFNLFDCKQTTKEICQSEVKSISQHFKSSFHASTKKQVPKSFSIDVGEIDTFKHA